MQKLQERSQKLQDGLRTAMQIILQLSSQLNEVAGDDDAAAMLQNQPVQ